MPKTIEKQRLHIAKLRSALKVAVKYLKDTECPLDIIRRLEKQYE